MKKLPLLVALSLAANLALAALLFFRPSAPASLSTNRLARATAGDPKSARPSAEDRVVPAPEAALGRAFSRFAEKMRAAQNATAGDGRWWRSKGSGGAMSGMSREQLLAARRELSEAMIAAFGDDLGIGGTDTTQLAFLSPTKRDALRRITQDYDEMMAKFAGEGGIQFASDREKLKLLRAERERDIAALLSPDELAAYEMRTSASAATVKARFGDSIASEDEFAKIFALQKAHDQKFPREALAGRITSDVLATRAAAERQLQADIEAALGSDRFAALRRASDQDLRTLDVLTQRLNLPTGTTDSIVTSRDAYGAESQRINADTSLTPQQRRAQIQDLGNRAKADLARTLGTEGADAYAQRTTWLNLLQNGTAFSNTPPANGSPGTLFGGTQSVYPVLPTGGNAGRPAVVSGMTTVSNANAAPIGDTFFIGSGGAPVVRDSVQVFSFTNATEVSEVSAPTTGPVEVAFRRPDPTAPATSPQPPNATVGDPAPIK